MKKNEIHSHDFDPNVKIIKVEENIDTATLDSNFDGTNELTPETFTNKIEISKAHKNSVGVPAIISSLKQINKWMNLADAKKTMFKINQKGGFDCPGCAWPDPDDERSALGEYCENGIKAIAEEATNKSLNADFFKKHTIQELSQWSDFELGKSGRLTQPMILKNSNYEPIKWEEAFELIAQNLNSLKSPDEAIFYTSGRTSNEAAFLYQLFTKEYGTNNLPDCSNMCHESSGKGLSATLGLGKGSVTLDDFNHSELVIVIGQNPATNHPRMLSALEKCKQNGGTIVAINPLPEAGLIKFVNPQNPFKILTNGTKLSDLFLQIKINGDVALLKATMYLLLQKEKQNPNTIFDNDFIKEKTFGFDEFIKDLENQDFKKLVKECGIEESLIIQFADLCASKKRIIICWAMGLTQHKNAVDNIKEIVNLLLLKGSIGIKGGGTCPVRGHSNVQGDRTMGIWEEPPESLLNKIKEVFGFEPPRKHGYDVVNAIKAMHNKQASVFIALGGNFISATPDTIYTAEALRNCKLTVHISTKLNRSHLIHGDNALILPCLGRTDIDIQDNKEQFVTCENSMGVVQSSKGVLTPCSKELKSEVEIVCQIANSTLGKKSKIEWLQLKNNYDLIRNYIEKVIPGFDDFNNKVRQLGGFYLPNLPREQKFATKTNKANFTINNIANLKLEKDEYLMMTIRSHDQYNTTIYGLDDRYRGIYNERRIIFMNESDMLENGLKKLDVVDLVSNFNGIKREANKFLVVPYDIPKSNVATYFPEANTLISIDSYADISKTPTSKSVIIKIKKAN